MSEYHQQCPIPLEEYPRVVLAHGGGGKMTHQLISNMFLPLLKNEYLGQEHDGVVLPTSEKNIAFTSDSHVIQPLFYPGGDIGYLAVYGTVNDLAMCGARPLYLSLSFIIEEGFAMKNLWLICQSIQKAAVKAGVKIVTGDTKVINRTKGEELYINTSGIGIVEHNLDIQPRSIKAGDVIIVNGDLGRHGIAVLANREGLEFETELESDCAPLNGLVSSLLEAQIPIHCLRDLTRGGLVSALVEIAKTAQAHITIFENNIPIRQEVIGACEILGFDPLYVANEGKFICFVPPEYGDLTVETLKNNPLGKDAAIIGRVAKGKSGLVVAQNEYGGSRILDMFSGEQLPRIC